MSSRILYVEDEEDYQLLVRRILERTDFSVETVETCKEGLASVRKNKPDLLILDVNLPDGDGYSICEELRKTYMGTDLPILMLTVRRRPEEWLRGFSVGANDYVPKPINPPELIERIQYCLQISGEPSPNRSPEYLLIQAASEGNRGAFEVLIKKYRSRLQDNIARVTGNPAEADDIMAQAFTQAYLNLHQFRGGCAFYTWLYRIALNEAYRLKQRKNTISLDAFEYDEAWPEALLVQDATTVQLHQESDYHHLSQAVKTVPRPYRQMLELHVMKGYSYQAIAQRLNIPPGTVMSRLFKAKELLRKSWHQLG